MKYLSRGATLKITKKLEVVYDSICYDFLQVIRIHLVLVFYAYITEKSKQPSCVETLITNYRFPLRADISEANRPQL